ncbi:MAG TPA: Nramp family divalent metal transporter [Verrucomicrobiae bacterium]|jgi:NRAMP (natural resistance-associated macrophage protein)-like metal ion transporter|nr:Nramp family divalent metal transporter [Verrucomicrobiae bacterium]
MRWLKSWKTRTLLILAVVGPGFITANVDNDAGGIYTYSLAGAQFGHSLLWSLIPITLALIVIQEMSARMGAVTGKGLSDLIREEYGFRATFLMMVMLVAINLMNVVAEFIGVATSVELFDVSKYISVPIAAGLVWLMVTKGNYKSVEKIFLTASFFYVCYIVAGFFAHPNWPDALRATVAPPSRHVFSNKGYIYMLIGVIGTTIAPWMQFYLQASVVEKGVTAREYKTSRLDVILGCVFTDVVAWFIIVACAATLYVAGQHNIENGAHAARALKPLAGEYAFLLFGAGLFNASLFAASILPLSTAYTVCEGLGFESGLDKKFSEAPVFYWLYTILVGAGAVAVMFIPNRLLIKVSVLSQVLNGVLLPPVLIYMLLLINKSSLMGKYVNSRIFNIIAWVTTAILIGLSITWAMVGQ